LTFYVYLLVCSDDSIYVGHSDNLKPVCALTVRGGFPVTLPNAFLSRLSSTNNSALVRKPSLRSVDSKAGPAPRSSRWPAANGLASLNSLPYVRRIAGKIL